MELDLEAGQVVEAGFGELAQRLAVKMLWRSTKLRADLSSDDDTGTPAAAESLTLIHLPYRFEGHQGNRTGHPPLPCRARGTIRMISFCDRTALAPHQT
jgi:hypothetical protein